MPDPSQGRAPARLDRRIQWLQLSLDPAVMWPGVTRESFLAARRDIAEVTRQALNGHPPVPTLQTRPGWGVRTLGIAAFASGMGPLLAYWAEQGVIRATPDVLPVLRVHRSHSASRHAMLADRLGDILEAMRSRRVTPALLKGMHTAWSYFPDPGTRTIADIDLLVSPPQLARASDALHSVGLVETRRTRQPFRSEWRPPGPQSIHSLELDHADNPWSVDLHIALARRYTRGLTASLGSATSGRTQPIMIGGHQARGLAQPWLTAFLALHCSYGLESLQLARLVELALVIRRDLPSDKLQWTALRKLLDQTGTTRFVYPGLELTEALAPGTVDEGLHAHVRAAATPRARRVVRAILEDGTYQLAHRSLDDRLMWASGPLEILLNASELIWPSEDSLIDAIRRHGRRLQALLGRRWRIQAGPARIPTTSPVPEPSQQRSGTDQA